MATELATAYISLVPSMRGAQGEIAKSLLPDAQSAGDAAGEATGSRFAAKFKGILAGAAIGAAIVGSFKGLYEVGGIFDDVSDTIRVGTGATGQALTDLSQVAKDVGNTIPTSFEKAGSTVADLNTRLGLSGDNLQTVASQYLEAGRILGEDVDVQTTTAAFSAFGIEGDKVSGAMDELFRVSQATGVGMNELASSVQKNAPAVQNLGFSFSDTAALAGSLDKAGLNTGQIMGSLSKSLVTLAKDGQKPADAFHDVVGQLQGFISAGDTASAINLAGKVFGTKGASQLVGAIQSGTLALDDLSGAAGLSSDTILGVAGETADFAESWTLVKNNALSALEPLGTAIFNIAGGGMQKVAQLAQAVGPQISAGLTNGLAAVGPLFSSLGGALGPLIGSALSLWQSLSPLSLIFKVLQPILPQLAAVFGQLAQTIGVSLNTVLVSLLSALAPVVTALTGNLSSVLATLLPVIAQVAMVIAGALGAALIQLAPLVGQIAGVLGGVLLTVLNAVSPLFGLAATLVMTLLTALMPIIPIVLQLVAALVPLVGQLISALAPALTAIVPLFSLLLTAIMPLITMIIGLLIPVIQALLPVITTVFGAVVSIITAAMQIVQGIIQVVTGLISGNWAQVWAGLGNIVSGAWALIKAVVSGALAIVQSVIGAALNVIRSVFSAGWNALSGIVSSAMSGVGSAVSTGISTAVSFVASLPGKAASALGDLGSLLASSGRALIQGFIDGIKAMVGKVGDAVGSVLDFAKGFFPNSPADRGPFSGAGWRRITKSGGAIMDAFMDGFPSDGVDLGAALQPTSFTPRLPSSAAAGSAAAATAAAVPAGGRTYAPVFQYGGKEFTEQDFLNAMHQIEVLTG